MQNELLALIPEYLPLGLILYDKEGYLKYADNIAFDSDRDAALAAGCNYFMTKPVNKPKLMELLAKYC